MVVSQYLIFTTTCHWKYMIKGQSKQPKNAIINHINQLQIIQINNHTFLSIFTLFGSYRIHNNKITYFHINNDIKQKLIKFHSTWILQWFWLNLSKIYPSVNTQYKHLLWRQERQLHFSVRLSLRLPSENDPRIKEKLWTIP